MLEKAGNDGKMGFLKGKLPGMDESGVCGVREKEMIAEEKANVECDRGDRACRQGKRKENKAGQHDFHV